MKSRRVQKIVGIVLLVVLAIPVIVMSIPSTYAELEFHTNPNTGLVEPVYTYYTYNPLITLLRSMDGTPDDIAVLGVYAGLFALAVWLVVHSTRRKLKEAQQWQT